MENCTKMYGDKEVLSNISFSLTSGMHFIKGDNGSGKSVLLRSVATVEEFSSGNYKNKAKNILYLTDQSLTHHYLTIAENISLLYSIHKIVLTSKEEEIIKSFYTTDQLNTVSENASLGMKLKVGCSLLAKQNHWDLVILDETFSGIDYSSRDLLLEICENLVKQGTCILVVSHNSLEREYLYKSTVIELAEGRLVQNGK